MSGEPRFNQIDDKCTEKTPDNFHKMIINDGGLRADSTLTHFYSRYLGDSQKMIFSEDIWSIGDYILNYKTSMDDLEIVRIDVDYNECYNLKHLETGAILGQIFNEKYYEFKYKPITVIKNEYPDRPNIELFDHILLKEHRRGRNLGVHFNHFLSGQNFKELTNKMKDMTLESDHVDQKYTEKINSSN